MSDSIHDSEDRYLLVKGFAGLGNRIECLLTCVMYAKLTGRTLVVDWADPTYGRGGENVFPRLFSLTGLRCAERIPSTDSVKPGPWRGRLSEPAEVVIHASKETGNKAACELLERLDHPEQVLVVWLFFQQFDILRRHFTGAFERYAGMSNQAIMDELLREHVRPLTAIQDEIEAFKAEHFGERMVGVHIRYSDRRAPLSLYHRAIEQIRLRNPDAGLFLATDNRAVVDDCRARYGGVKIQEVWRPEKAGAAMHESPEAPDPFRGAVEAVIDMYLLAGCDALVYSGKSTFTVIARAGLSSRDAGVQIDIEALPYRVSVVVTAEQGCGDGEVRDTLASLEHSGYAAELTQVVLADGRKAGGKDGPVVKGVHVVHEAGADRYRLRNLGFQESDGEVIAYLACPSQAEPDWLVNGMACLRSGAAVGLVTGPVLPPTAPPGQTPAISGYTNTAYRAWLGLHPHNEYAVYIERYGLRPCEHLLAYRYVLEDVGEFSGPPAWMAELDWWRRFDSKKCYKYIFAPDVVVRLEGRRRGSAGVIAGVMQRARARTRDKPDQGYFSLKKFLQSVVTPWRDLKYIGSQSVPIKRRYRFMAAAISLSYLRLLCLWWYYFDLRLRRKLGVGVATRQGEPPLPMQSAVIGEGFQGGDAGEVDDVLVGPKLHGGPGLFGELVADNEGVAGVDNGLEVVAEEVL